MDETSYNQIKKMNSNNTDKIFVFSLEGEQFAIDFDPTDTVEVLKAKSKVRGQKKDWDDSGTAIPEIPEYLVTEDKFASVNLTGLKRQKRLKAYLNQVYANG